MQTINTAGIALENWLIYWGGERRVFIPLGRWPGSLGQGSCGRIPLARAGVLEGASSIYNQGLDSGGLGRTTLDDLKIRGGVKPGNCQGNRFLPRVDGGPVPAVLTFKVLGLKPLLHFFHDALQWLTVIILVLKRPTRGLL